ncbi:MAG: MBL fold metallo-hydrolase [Candidatus Marinimicrobia bacterium]|nr:MBL fold metallo-hydrolase [Candidatus Neomarinimicrobiota bacterium]
MFIEKIKSEGLAHLSYIVGDGDEAVVVDPRRDCEVYIKIAQREGVRITHIFETHRNEDYVIGSCDLARRTGAVIHHGVGLDFAYGESVAEDDAFAVGDLRLRVLHTPGHTLESISLVLTDRSSGETPVAVFTGDALFVGDVGRTDFYPDRKREVAGLLYDSLFNKLLPLGDQAILYPAHGAGSVCGDSMAAREFSTLGHERRHNPVLQKTEREAFIDYKVNEHHTQPAYFRKMEALNKDGAPPLDRLPVPVPMTPAAVNQAVKDGALLLDLRSPEAIAGAFIPGSLAIPLDMLPAYAGYLLEYDYDLVLVPEEPEQVPVAVRYLIRMGYERISGYLKGGMHAWEVSGREYDRINAVHANTLNERLHGDTAFTLLDVRKASEFSAGRLHNATHIFLGDLQERLGELDRRQPVVTFCGSGRRAIIAASILKRHGFESVEDALGSMAACKRVGCSIVEG